MSEPVCDLVLLSWNHLEETQPCLESLFRTTTVPSRLFIVDNGSELGVRRALAQVKPQGHVQEVILLQNEKNEGFPKGMNRGMRKTSARYVCILNNDLLFTPGWLEELIHVAELDPQIGLVNPGSSTFGDIPKTGTSIDAHAEHQRARHGEYNEVGMCIGFCVLIKRAVIDRIGVLTEEVERIFFEDEDYSMRAQQAGFNCVVAEGAYVFHAEHKTVQKMPEREALFSRNRNWCEQKWGKRLRMAWPILNPVKPGSPELRACLSQLIQWARRRTHVYVCGPLPKGASREELFRSVGLVPHADIQWWPVPAAATRLMTTARILMRRKKQFDLIAAPDNRWANTMRRLGRLHHAEVILQQEDQLVEAWKRKPR